MAEAKQLADGRFECQNCLKRFHKNAKTYIDPKFCSDNCRKEFHYSGAMSQRKLKTLVERWMRQEWERLKSGEVA